MSTRAYIDVGSHTSATTSKYAQKLGLNIKNSSYQVAGISSEKKVIESFTCIIKSQLGNDHPIDIIPEITREDVNEET